MPFWYLWEDQIFFKKEGKKEENTQENALAGLKGDRKIPLTRLGGKVNINLGLNINLNIILVLT